MTENKSESTVVLSVDDNPLMGDTAERWLRGKPGFHYAGHMLSGEGVVDAISLNGVTVILLDLEIPGTDTCRLIESICIACPECRVLVLSGHCRPDDILECLSAGAHGYVLKFRDPAYIVGAIETVATGEPFICDEAARAAGLS
ncbi:MAG: response regulator transcription factor [Phycisphaeraceae bacterium]|nr:response regulator transcription factor [Phycisphaeraceae bacterium]